MNGAESEPTRAGTAPAGQEAPRGVLSVRNVSKSFGESEILRQVSFELQVGETLAVLGDSGCGKTTLLRILAGLLPATSGEIILCGRPLSGVPARERGIVYLDQEPLLFEHLTVSENVGFAPRLKGLPRREVAATVDEMLQAVGLADLAGRREWQISGGQKQRVAFARAVLARPQVLLLDEPFSSLDGRNRAAMQQLFDDLRTRYALTSLFVTHDVKEAVQVGHRFAMMSEGSLRMYADRAEFLADEATGIPSEMRFWKECAGGSPETP